MNITGVQVCRPQAFQLEIQQMEGRVQFIYGECTDLLRTHIHKDTQSIRIRLDVYFMT